MTHTHDNGDGSDTHTHTHTKQMRFMRDDERLRENSGTPETSLFLCCFRLTYGIACVQRVAGRLGALEPVGAGATAHGQ